MGKKLGYGGGGVGTPKGSQKHVGRQLRSDSEIAQSIIRRSRTDSAGSFAMVAESVDGSDSGDDDSLSGEHADSSGALPFHSKIFMWEFNQNDPKRDSGSKLCRLGYASVLRVGASYNGIVLSSEAKTFASAADRELVEKYGISGINCSWNRLEEIPFASMGKPRSHRILPLIYAANTVNYGKPYKMNTAEAIAACLYITGFKDDARSMLSSFSYGMEFLRLNHELLERYAQCRDSDEIQQFQDEYIAHCNAVKLQKEQKKQFERFQHEGGLCMSYLDENDLPPTGSDDEYYQDYEDEVTAALEHTADSQEQGTVDSFGNTVFTAAAAAASATRILSPAVARAVDR